MIPVPEVSDIDAAFGSGAMKILPPYAEIPDEFKPHGFAAVGGKTHYFGKEGVTIQAKWMGVVSDWFFFGLRGAQWKAKPGVDVRKALRAVKCCMGSFEPSHEHKEAGCAYLLSQWFEDVTYTRGERESAS